MKWILKLAAGMVLCVSFIFFIQEKLMTKKEKTIVTIETTSGTFEATLFPETAPKTCENFLKHAEKNYYTNTFFHRIIPQFMIQGGDPDGTGAGGESIWGKPFEDECTKDLKFDKPGYLAMANRGPNTNGSQFFITTVPTPWLNMKHTIFGEITQGHDIIKKIEDTGSASGRPSSKTTIVKITVKKA